MCDVIYIHAKIQFFLENGVVQQSASLFIYFWLRSDRARQRRIAAAQSFGLAIVVSQWRLISRVAIAAALRLLLRNRLQRRLLVKPRNASFFQDIVPGWNDANLKGISA